jgi:hypothetical protein
VDTALVWVSWGLVAAGVVAVVTAVMSLSGRLRPLRRARRRLRWRRAQLERLRTRAEATRDWIEAVAEQAQALPAESVRTLARRRNGPKDAHNTRP